MVQITLSVAFVLAAAAIAPVVAHPLGEREHPHRGMGMGGGIRHGGEFGGRHGHEGHEGHGEFGVGRHGHHEVGGGFPHPHHHQEQPANE